MVRWFSVKAVPFLLLTLLAGCGGADAEFGWKRNCVVDTQGVKTCGSLYIEVRVNVHPEPEYVPPLDYCGPYDSRCKVQLGGDGPSLSISGGGVSSPGDPNRGIVKDYTFDEAARRQKYR